MFGLTTDSHTHQRTEVDERGGVWWDTTDARDRTDASLKWQVALYKSNEL